MTADESGLRGFQIIGVLIVNNGVFLIIAITLL